MAQIEAVFQGGVFKPLGSVALAENQRVRLIMEPLAASDARAWLERVRARQQAFVARHGFLPDSTPDIAEDRTRDV